MHTKQSIALQLRHLLELVELSETDADARRSIRRHRTSDMFGDEHVEHRLWRIERELHNLAERSTGRCQFSEGDSTRVIDLMTGRGTAARERSIKFLSQWLGDPQKLTVADPYFVKNTGTISESIYTASLAAVLPRSITSLELFAGIRTPKYRREPVATWIDSYCQQHCIALSVYNQEEIHDRVWIVDDDKALVVGASFNGIGDKCAFILPLDQDDTASFSAELQRIRKTVAAANQA